MLDSLGHNKAILGSGTVSPVRVKPPDAYQGGRFQVRIVATSPGLAVVPSNLFRITTQSITTDLSLKMDVSQRTPDMNAPLTVTLLVRNDGANAVSNTTIRNRLPDNLAVILASGLLLNGSVLTGTISNLAAGATATLRFVAQPTAAGTYRNAVEITQSSLSDPDSQFGSGTGDGQDDVASVDFRTRQSSSAVFTSPNPDQVPLPAISPRPTRPKPTLA